MATTSTNDREAPRSVAIVAMGPSRNDYIAECVAQSGRFRVADETWCVNAMAGIIEHDRAIIMDRLTYFAEAAKVNQPLDGYRDWLHRTTKPIYSQKHYSEFPTSVEYPLQDVLNTLKYAYFNTTVAFAVALAIHIGVKQIKMYGCDFTNNENRGFAEAGRACVEFWLRDATWRGIQVTIAPSSTLCDQCLGRPLYGYSFQPQIGTDAEGKLVVTHSKE